MKKDVTFENITALKLSPCPTCDANLNGATHSDDEAISPRPGDYSMCWYCGEYLRFDDDMQLRLLTSKDIVEAPLTELAEMRRYIKPKKH